VRVVADTGRVSTLHSEIGRRRFRFPCHPPLAYGRIDAMNLTLRILDEIAERLGATGPDLERQALEELVAESWLGH